MDPATVALIESIASDLAGPVYNLVMSIATKQSEADQEAAQIRLIRAIEDKRAAAKFGPLPPSSLG